MKAMLGGHAVASRTFGGYRQCFICILISDYSIYLVETRTRQDVYPIASCGRREIGGLPRQSVSNVQ